MARANISRLTCQLVMRTELLVQLSAMKFQSKNPHWPIVFFLYSQLGFFFFLAWNLKIPAWIEKLKMTSSFCFVPLRRTVEKGLPDKSIEINMVGSGGQSFCAFLAKGVSVYLEGDANDYVCKVHPEDSFKTQDS